LAPLKALVWQDAEGKSYHAPDWIAASAGLIGGVAAVSTVLAAIANDATK
jgi:hypothetical protein